MRPGAYNSRGRRGSTLRNNSGDSVLAGARRHRPDYWLLILMVTMLGIGLIIVYAISPALAKSSGVSNSYFVTKQLIAIALSLVAFAVTSRLPVGVWRQVSRSLLIVAAVATLLAIIMPVNPHYPAHRWVRLGSFSFQSVELLKFALLVWLAGFLTQRAHEGTMADVQRTLKPLLIVLGVVGLFVAGVQSDLGSTGVIVAIMGVMAFVAGLPMKRALMVLGIIAIGVTLAVAAVPYRRERLLAFTEPESHCLDSGYQACQALIAVGSGGMFGLGLGKSVQAYGYLPEAANDSIFAIYAEKFGFIGSVSLLGVLIAFFYRLKLVAERVPDEFSRLLVVGILTWLSVQAFINIGAMLGLLPLKGITLPFISYGGTSVVFASAAVGIVFQISRYTNFTSPLEGRRRRT
ncbi:cell division protein FtsW [Candidatus Saccharibacteria bacterium]|nr:cell division protein FtsW [Candidatus Saccharibacteria bacterium]